LFIFGLVITWLFGREFIDGTAHDLLALPTHRESIVIAKLIVAAIWPALLTAEVLLLGLGVGSATGLTGWSAPLALDAARQIALTASLTVLVTMPLAWVASAGRGYLAPVGAMLLLPFLAQILVAVGWGPYFPWSVPALHSGAGGPDLPPLMLPSYVLVVGVGLGGASLMLLRWRFADHTG
jgi:ABC-2 type transport system permease protein